MKTLIRGGRLIDPSRGLDMISDLLIENDKIIGIGTGIAVPDASILIDASNLIVSPGFIDIHCHLREPGEEHKETIATGTAAGAKGGFTTLCAMPNTIPAMDNPEMLLDIKARAEKFGIVKVIPIGSVTLGRYGKILTDMRGMADAGAIGFSDDGNPIADYHIMHKALLQAKALGLPIINHCEDPSLSKNGVMNEGIVASALGLPGWPSLAEENMVKRDIELAMQTNSKVHLAHISTRGSVEFIRQAKNMGINITAEATPHHLTITEEWVRPINDSMLKYNTNAKVNPPLRTKEDVDAIVLALSDGTIDCIGTDHAPHSTEDKSYSFEDASFGISGLETAFGALMSLVHKNRIDLSTLIKSLTYAPARIINKPDICTGTLDVGSRADVTIFDPDLRWQVKSDLFISKGKNTPIAEEFLQGYIKTTIVDGRIVYESEDPIIVD